MSVSKSMCLLAIALGMWLLDRLTTNHKGWALRKCRGLLNHGNKCVAITSSIMFKMLLFFPKRCICCGTREKCCFFKPFVRRGKTVFQIILVTLVMNGFTVLLMFLVFFRDELFIFFSFIYFCRLPPNTDRNRTQ